jgi:hypothetical protein
MGSGESGDEPPGSGAMEFVTYKLVIHFSG